MGFLSDTLRALQVAGQPLTAKVVAEWLSGGAPSVTGLTVSPESALGVTAVWDCVDLISSDVARTPLHLYRRMPDGGREPVSGPLQTLLEERPNPYMTAFDFRKAIEAQKLLRGNAFAEIERDRNGAIIALWPLRSDRMQRPQESQAGTLLYTYTLPDGKAATLRQDQVLHLRGFTDDGIWGKSPVQVHRETIGVAMAQKEYTARFYGNNARPGGYLSVDKRLTDEAARRLKGSWNEMHQGLSNAHRVGVLEEGVKWNAIGMTNEDAEFLNTAKYTRIEIASIYHVPAHKIGELDRMTFSNVEELALEYVADTLDTEYAAWEQTCNMALLTPRQIETFYIEFIRNALVRTTIDKRYQAYDRAWWMTPNEIRALENMNALPGLDEIVLPVNRMPLSLMEAQALKPAPVRELQRVGSGYRVIEAPHE